MKLSESFKNRMHELSGVKNKKSSKRLNETVVEETWSKVQRVIDALGESTTLDAVVRAMDDEIANQIFDYIIREYELNKEDNEDNEEQPSDEESRDGLKNIFTDKGIDTGMGNFSLNEGKAKDIFDSHREKIAISTLKMSDVGAAIMGGMSKEEARTFLISLGYTPEKIQNIENFKK